MDTVYKEELPECDLCDRDARYDSKTTSGPHAFLCEEHYNQVGVPPTTRLELTPDNDVEEPEEVKTVSVPLTMDSMAEVSCPYCDHPRRVEPDANYTIECEACGNEYKVRSMI